MRKLLLATVFAAVMAAQTAKEHWLLTFQLSRDVDLAHLTDTQKAVFAEHGKYLSTLYSKGLIAGGRTNDFPDTLAILILACDEATARAAVAADPATRAGYLKSAARPFTLALPPAPKLREQ